MEVIVNKSSYQRARFVTGTNTPTDAYRCPVSSPNAVVQQPHPIASSQVGFMTDRTSPQQRGSLLVTYKGRQRPSGKLGSLLTPRDRSMDYYYVNNRSQTNLDKQIESPWVNSLCAQPVDEIFGKYKKQFEMQRMKQLWTKTFTTPGEKALLDVWMKNAPKKKSNLRKTESRITKSSASFSTKSDRKSQHKSPASPLPNVRESPPLHNTPESEKYYPEDDLDSNPPPPVPQPTAIEIPHEGLGAEPEVNELSTLRELNADSATPTPRAQNMNLVVNKEFYDQFRRREPRMLNVKTSRVEIQTARHYISAEQMFPPVVDPKPQLECRPFSPAKRYRHKLGGKSVPDKTGFASSKLPQLVEKG